MLIELQDLGKSFGEHEVLKHVTASVERGDRIGIIGANGTGKTTLLRVLCGESLPDAGDAAFAAGATCGYLEQTGHLDPEKDVYETMRLAFQPALDAMAELETLQKQLAADHHNTAITDKITACNAVIDAMDAYNMDTQIKKVLNGMGFPADTWKKKAGVLSGGEQTRLRLARLLLERPDILILDEPTNHLDLETMDWLETYLKAYRGAVLVVSHDRYFLDSVCTRIWELRGKTITTYRGNYSAYLPQREAADERLQKQHDADVEKAAKLQDYIDRNLVRASTTKMAQSRRKQLEKLEITEAPQAEAHQADHVGACIGQVVQCVRRNGHTAKQGAHRKLARKQQHIAHNPHHTGQVAVSSAHGAVLDIGRITDKKSDQKFCQELLFPSPTDMDIRN